MSQLPVVDLSLSGANVASINNGRLTWKIDGGVVAPYVALSKLLWLGTEQLWKELEIMEFHVQHHSPPCETMSAARFSGSPGPPPVRSGTPFLGAPANNKCHIIVRCRGC